MSECARLTEREEEWNAIMPFLEWLEEHGMFLCEMVQLEYRSCHCNRIGKSMEQVLYEYFGIDSKKLEEERRELLERLKKG